MEKLKGILGLSAAATAFILASCGESKYSVDISEPARITGLEDKPAWQMPVSADGNTSILVPAEFAMTVRQCNDGEFVETDENECSTTRVIIDKDEFEGLERDDIVRMENDEVIVLQD